MMHALLYRLTDHLPARIISDAGQPYLERYYVGTVFGTRFYLHRFVASDPDRGWHDHPWPWAFSIILSESYLEETRAGTRHVRWFNFLVGDSFHRVILRQRYGRTLPVWTQFAHRAKRVKRWGFLRELVMSPTDPTYVYTLHRPSVDEHWWLTAPKGRDVRAGRA